MDTTLNDSASCRPVRHQPCHCTGCSPFSRATGGMRRGLIITVIPPVQGWGNAPSTHTCATVRAPLNAGVIVHFLEYRRHARQIQCRNDCLDGYYIMYIIYGSEQKRTCMHLQTYTHAQAPKRTHTRKFAAQNIYDNNLIWFVYL